MGAGTVRIENQGKLGNQPFYREHSAPIRSLKDLTHSKHKAYKNRPKIAQKA
jgi:hypothetical protein